MGYGGNGGKRAALTKRLCEACVTTQGYMLGVLSATLSAMAGVYTEFLMKQNDDSLYWQNVQLYSFGVLFNASALTIDDFQHGFLHGFWPHTMFNGTCGLAVSQYTDGDRRRLHHVCVVDACASRGAGYNPVVWCVVMNLAFTGLLVSWIMKFADTIVKVYSTSMAMLVTMLVSAWLFNVQPNLQVCLPGPNTPQPLARSLAHCVEQR